MLGCTSPTPYVAFALSVIKLIDSSPHKGYADYARSALAHSRRDTHCGHHIRFCETATRQVSSIRVVALFATTGFDMNND